MSKTKDGIRQQIEAIMDQVTQPMKQARVAVDPIKVASEVDLILDPSQIAPLGKTYCSIMQLRQIAREYLRNQNDPFKIVEDYMEHGDDEQMRLFEDHLQDYYPVTRKDAPEESPRSIYIPIEQLTHTDVARICSRMDKASGALAKHSRNLMAWFMSRAA